MRAAFPAAAAFVVWIMGLWGAWFCARQLRRSLNEARYRTALACAVAGIAALALWAASPFSLVSQSKAFASSEGANQPMGVGKGIFPGRVVWVRDPGAALWGGSTGHYWDSNAVDQTKVENMISLSIRRVTGKESDAESWNAIFKYYNQNHGRGDRGYQAGEKIAVKINCNNCYSGYDDVDNDIDATPQSVLALLRQLVNVAGIPQTNITVYEAIRYVPDRIYTKCHAEFTQVVWVDSAGTGTSGNGRLPITWQTDAIVFSKTSLANMNSAACAAQADYLINMALLKGHGIAGVSLTAKNHLGSIAYPSTLHSDISGANSMGSYSPLVDLMASPYLGDKTALYLIDGLYGVHTVKETLPNYGRWNKLFAGQWSSSFFASLDPVAIDSVALDFLSSEFGDLLGNGTAVHAENYLHEAALADNPPSGTAYKTNGVRISSLGVHEHWNNVTDKKYSRNFGLNTGIELVSVQPYGGYTSLIAAESDWKFFANSAAPDSTWKTTNFNDSAWSSGPAELGYGNTYRTLVGYGSDAANKYITTYFRKLFTVSDPAAYTNLSVGLKRDGGAVIYLNNHELWRDNMPSGAVSYSTLATSSVSGNDETTFFHAECTNWLVAGTNVLAVELHQSSASNDDLSFDLTLTGNSPCSPMTVNYYKTTSNSVVFSWPDTPSDFRLSASGLLPTNFWAAITNSVFQYTNGRVQTAITLNTSNRFFRLKTP
jgi:hypothetical protein